MSEGGGEGEGQRDESQRLAAGRDDDQVLHVPEGGGRGRVRETSPSDWQPDVTMIRSFTCLRGEGGGGSERRVPATGSRT